MDARVVDVESDEGSNRWSWFVTCWVAFFAGSVCGKDSLSVRSLSTPG